MKANRPKICGFYDQKDVKASIFESLETSKKFVPAPSKYESRGKSMFQLVKEKTAKYKALDPFRIINPTEKRVDKIKKSNDPGPDTYKVAE